MILLLFSCCVHIFHHLLRKIQPFQLFKDDVWLLILSQLYQQPGEVSPPESLVNAALYALLQSSPVVALIAFRALNR